jgi:hypothetical protein
MGKSLCRLLLAIWFAFAVTVVGLVAITLAVSQVLGLVLNQHADPRRRAIPKDRAVIRAAAPTATTVHSVSLSSIFGQCLFAELRSNQCSEPCRHAVGNYGVRFRGDMSPIYKARFVTVEYFA